MLGLGSLLWALWEEGIPAIWGITLGLGSVLWALWEEGISAIRGIMLGLGSVLWALWEEGIPAISGNYDRSWQRPVGPLGRGNPCHLGNYARS